MRTMLTTFCIVSALVLSTPALADDDEEGVFSRSWRGFKSAIGLGTEQQATEDQERGHKKSKKDYDGKREYDDRDLDELRRRSRFTNEQAALIRQTLGISVDDDAYEGKKPKKLPPGLKKKLERGGELPPGWQKKFARGEVVSDEVWAQAHNLPSDLERRLGTLPGTELIQVNDRVARVLTSTREILDVIDLVTGP